MKSSDTNPSFSLKSAYNNGYLLAAIVVLLLGLLLGMRQVRSFPAFIHAWAQADHYALAIGFVDNGHDLFHPQTMIYNKQFPHTFHPGTLVYNKQVPDAWKIDDGSTVTAVDLPLHEYIVSFLMRLLGSTSPWVFRCFTLLVSLAGVWLLSLAAQRLTGDIFKSLLVAVVALTSPLYVYYFNNYLPTAPALALAMAGLWTYVRYFKEERIGYWHLAVGLVALATMIRSSQAVLLVALCAFETLRILRRKTNLWNKLPSVVAALAIIAGYMLWNGHLRHEYGSVFLNYLMPPRHAEDVQTVMDELHWHWRFDYFSRLQHWLVAAVCVAAVVLLIVKKKKREDRLSIGWLAAIWWLGEVCFFVAMFRQYQNHDYYFLDSFFLPVLFTFILALKVLPTIKGHLPGAIALVALVVLGCVMYGEAKHKLSDRCWEGDRAYLCSQHFKGADQWLDEEGVPKDAKILALLAYPQNSPFIQMKRKGYIVMEYDEDIVNAARKFPFGYVVMENEAYEHFIAEHPDEEFSYMMECIADNGTLSLFIYHTDENP